MNLCEELGTGIDKVIRSVELYQLPPPDFRSEGDGLRVVLLAPRQFTEITLEDKIRACYQHTALKYLSGQPMKNATLRQRFGIRLANSSQASILIRKTLAARLIRPADPDHPHAGYVPFWA